MNKREQKSHILVIDDEESICFAFKHYLEPRGYKVATASTARQGIDKCRNTQPEVVFLDVYLPDHNGLEALQELHQIYPGLPVIIITAYGSIETITKTVHLQAFDYLAKPIDPERTVELIEQALASRCNSSTAPAKEKKSGQSEGAVANTNQPPDTELIGTSAVMQEVYKRIGQAAATEAPVLLQGSTGTGKELAAKTIHTHSSRKDGHFMIVDCGALPQTLIESELFGHVKGAFTGADKDKAGLLESAHNGTVFLDEIGELPLSLQAKLLRFLDKGHVTRLGSLNTQAVNSRVVAATNRDLREAVESGKFRSDLYYRIAGIPIKLPDLAQRGDDIVSLAEYFIQLFSKNGSNVQLSKQAASYLKNYSWPGNVRELRNVIRNAVIAAGNSPILPAHLPEEITEASPAQPHTKFSQNNVQERLYDYLNACDMTQESLYQKVITPLEEALIQRVLENAGGNLTEAAKHLGIHRNTLRKKLQSDI